MTRRQCHRWQSSWIPGSQNNAPVLRVVPDLVNDLRISRPSVASPGEEGKGKTANGDILFCIPLTIQNYHADNASADMQQML